MRKLHLTASILLTCLLNSTAHAEDQACQLKRLASLEMTPAKDGTLLVPVTVQGTTLHFRLNAFGRTSITTQTVSRLGLQQKMPPDRPIEVLHGMRVQSLATVPLLSLGGAGGRIDLSNLTVPIDPKPSPPNTDADGTIGRDILFDFDLDLDFAKNMLNLFSTDHCPGQVVYWAKTYADLDMNIVFRVTSLGHDWKVLDAFTLDDNMDGAFQGTLDGEVKSFVFNTEITHARLPVVYEPEAYESTCQNGDCSKTVKVPGHITQTKSHYSEIGFGGISIKNPIIDFWTPTYAIEGTSAALRSQIGNPEFVEIGLDVMSKLHIYISTKERKYYFTGATQGL